MTTTKTTLHNFFDVLQCEHCELIGAVSEIRNLFTFHLRDLEQLRRSAPRLCSLLESHFLQEEEGGYLHDVVEKAPHLKPNVEALHRQHAALMDEVGEISEAVPRTGTVDELWWESYELRFEQFVNRLVLHEAHENDLLHRAESECRCRKV